MSTSRSMDSRLAGFWETWLPAITGDFIIVIRLLAYVLLLCTVPSVLGAKVSEFLGTASAIFLTSIYIFFQMDIFESSVATPIHRMSGEVESPSSLAKKEYTPSLSNKRSNILRRTCASIGKFMDNKKNLPKGIVDNFMIPWGDNESRQGGITGPEITRRKFKILFFLVAATIMLLILVVPAFNALGPIAVSKYLISKAVQSGIAHFATALLFGGFTYALRAPLIAAGIAVHYFFTNNPDTKRRLKGLVKEQDNLQTTSKNKDETAGSTVMYLKTFSPPPSPVRSLSPSSRNESNFSSPTGKKTPGPKSIMVVGQFDPHNPPLTISLPYLDKKQEPSYKSYKYHRKISPKVKAYVP